MSGRGLYPIVELPMLVINVYVMSSAYILYILNTSLGLNTSYLPLPVYKYFAVVANM